MRCQPIVNSAFTLPKQHKGRLEVGKVTAGIGCGLPLIENNRSLLVLGSLSAKVLASVTLKLCSLREVQIEFCGQFLICLDK